MRKSSVSFLVAIFSIVAIVHVSKAMTPEDQKTKDHLVEELKSLSENDATEAELRAKHNSELIDMVVDILRTRQANSPPDLFEMYGKRVKIFQGMKKVPKQEPLPVGSEAVHFVESEADFDEQLKKAGDKLVIVDFFAVWCGPCKIIAPHIRKMAESYGSAVQFMETDVDLNKEVAERYDIRGMPTFAFFKNGVEIGRILGSDVAKVQKFIEKSFN